LKKIEVEFKDSKKNKVKVSGVPPFVITGQTATVEVDISSLVDGTTSFKIKAEDSNGKVEFKLNIELE